MKTIVKPVYYCDFCGKRGLSKYHMGNHEKHCTMNPNRHCRVCDNDEVSKETIQKINNSFKLIVEKDDPALLYGEVVVKWLSEPINHDSLLKMADGCPACALALFRQSNLCCPEVYGEVGFDYQKAKSDHWRQRNDEQERYAMYY